MGAVDKTFVPFREQCPAAFNKQYSRVEAPSFPAAHGHNSIPSAHLTILDLKTPANFI
jgi:hypothetical protein